MRFDKIRRLLGQKSYNVTLVFKYDKDSWAKTKYSKIIADSRVDAAIKALNQEKLDTEWNQITILIKENTND